jgi:hypothetical protein
MRALAAVLLPALLAGFVNARAHDRAQVATSAIAAQSPCQFTMFEEQTSLTRRFYSNAEYDRAKTNASTECLRIQYLSEGLKVVLALRQCRFRRSSLTLAAGCAAVDADKSDVRGIRVYRSISV